MVINIPFFYNYQMKQSQKSQTSKDMGQLNICTLNYSGIGSPFQFYTEDAIKQQKVISYHFKQFKNYQFSQIKKPQKKQQFTSDLSLFIKKIQDTISNVKNNENQLQLYSATIYNIYFSEQPNQKQKIQKLIAKIQKDSDKLNINQLQTAISTSKQFTNNQFLMGTLDTVWNNYRYAPCYSINPGTMQFKNRKRLIDQKQFILYWDSVLIYNLRHNSSLLQYIIKKNLKQAIIHLYMCRIFDLCCYKTLALWYCDPYVRDYQIYSIQKEGKQKPKDKILCYNGLFNQIVQSLIFDQEYVKQYQNGQTAKFNQQYLKQNNKIQKIFENMIQTSCDIYCLQQVSQLFIGLIKCTTNIQQSMIPKKYDQNTVKKILNSYHLIQQTIKSPKSSSIILIKKSKVQLTQAMKNDFLKCYSEKFQLKTEQLEKYINFNNDSVFTCFKRNSKKYFILNVHLTSKKTPKQQPSANVQYNQAQVNKVFDLINCIKQLQYSVIACGDFNNNISKINSKQKSNLYCFPTDQNQVTSNKQRTTMQPQGSKAQVQDKSAKDFIISTSELTQQKIIMLQHNGNLNYSIKKGENIPIIPTKGHPLDHFGVTSWISPN